MKEIIVIGDVHYAHVWDKIDKLIPKKYYFLNSNIYLKKIVKMIKPKQHLVINGDQVDFHYADYVPNGATNWRYYHKVLAECKGEVDATFGNHDYRSHAYNLWISGLHHLNITRKVQGKYLTSFAFQKFRFLGELKAVVGNVKDKLRRKFKRHYYSKSANGQKLIFLDTGADNFNFFVYLRPSRWSDMFVRPPDSIGLSDKQINFLKKELAEKKKEHLVFMHAPAFFSVKKIKQMKVTRKIKKLCYGTFNNNQYKFVETLMESDQNIVVINSHIHVPKHYLIDKKTRMLKECSIKEINKLRDDGRYIKFISILPLGAIEPLNKKLGYLVIGKKIEHRVIADYGK